MTGDLGASGLEAEVRLTRGELRLEAAVGAGPGSVVAVVGPNGAGKSTLLRAIAGLQPVDGGRIVIGGDVVDDPAAGAWVPPERRSVGMVFQRSLLLDHLDALDNVASPLRATGVGRRAARQVAARWLDDVGAGDCARRRPAALSGGQAQRVALARALARQPRLLLLDEPLAAVDAEGRIQLRRELARHLKGFAGAQVMVTHDPVEALALASTVVVLEEGRVTQAGTPGELRARPTTRYVAALVGVNTLAGTVRDGSVHLGGTTTIVAAPAPPLQGEVTALVHPRAVSIHRQEPRGSPRNVWRATVAGLWLQGDVVRVELAGPVPLVSDVTPAAVSDLGLAPGMDVWASIKATEVAVEAR